jgi:hypothetical protein
MPTGRKVRGDPERVLLSFPLRSVIGSNRKQEIPFAGHTREKMKPKPRKRILGVLATVLLLIFFQLPFAPIASGALLPGGWPDTPSIFDPLGDDSPGRDIYEGAWWAYSGGSYYFRMDLLGSFNKNSYYGFYFDTDGNSGTGGSFSGSGLNLAGIDMFVSSYYNNRGLFINTNLQTWNTGLNDWNSPTSLPPGSFESLDNAEHILEWRVASGNFPSGLFTWYGATMNNNQNLKDITGPVVTPIPNAAWLLGSGIIALVGLRRRGISRNDTGRV